MRTQNTWTFLLVLSLPALLLFQNCGELRPDQNLVDQTSNMETEMSLTAELKTDPALLLWKTADAQAASLSQTTHALNQWGTVFIFDPTNASGTVMRLYADVQQETMEVRLEGSQLVIERWSDSSNYGIFSMTLPLTQISVIGISVMATADAPLIYLNGAYQGITSTGNGSLSAPRTVDRDLTVSSAMPEFVMFSRSLTGPELTSLSRMIGRNWGMGELPFDPGPQTAPSGGGSSAEFLAAQALLNSKCVACHGTWAGYSENNFSTVSSTYLGASQHLIEPNNPDASVIIEVVKQPASSSTHMPKSGDSLTADEIAVLTAWANNFGKKSTTTAPTTTPTPTPTPSATPTPGPSTNPYRTAAMAVLSTNCTSCHGNWTNQPDSFFVQSDGTGMLVAKGLPDSSTLYLRLNYTDVNQRMPLGRAALSGQDSLTLRNWILNMQ